MLVTNEHDYDKPHLYQPERLQERLVIQLSGIPKLTAELALVLRTDTATLRYLLMRLQQGGLASREGSGWIRGTCHDRSPQQQRAIDRHTAAPPRVPLPSVRASAPAPRLGHLARRRRNRRPASRQRIDSTAVLPKSG